MRPVRAVQAGAVLVAVAVGSQSARLALTSTWPAFSGTSRTETLLGLAAGAALLATGVVELASAATRAAGALLVAAAACWLLTAWDSPDAPSWPFALGRLVRAAWPVLLTHAFLLTGGRPTRAGRAALAVAYACAFGLSGVATTIFFDPAAHACADCPGNPILIVGSFRATLAFERAGVVAGTVWTLLLLVALSRHMAAATRSQRRDQLPASLLGMAIAVALGLGYLRALSGRTEGGVQPSAVHSVLLVAVPLAVGWPTLALELTRRRLARLVVEVSSAPPVGGLGRMLGAVVHDPTARLLYPRQPGSQELIDAAGEPAEQRGELTALARGTETVAYLEHQRPLTEPDGGAIARGTRLSLDHERLHAQRTAHLRELRESRVRIVAAADRSRRHLERNLHDGAQSQLVTLALALRVGALTRSEPGSARLAEVEAEVVTALAELRSIARGLYPRELADEGLVSALETLADLDPTPLELDLDLPVPGPRQVESAAYYVAGAVLTTSAHDPTAHRRLRARLRDRRLELDLQGGSAFDLESIRDRVGAVDGTVERLAADRVRIELPCGS